MTGLRRVVLAAMAGCLLLGAGAAFPRVAEATRERTAVMGIVDRVDGSFITMGGAVYDVKGARIVSADGSQPPELSALAGKTVELLFRKRKVESVTVYRTVPQ